MTASEQFRNVTRTVFVCLAAALAASSAPRPALVPADDAKFSSETVPSFVRVGFAPVSETSMGRVVDSGIRYRCTLCRFAVIAECYARGSSTEPGTQIDEQDRIADVVSNALRYKDLPLYDYVTTPGTGTLVPSVAIRFDRPPSRTSPPSDSGWARRIVTVEGWYLSRTVEV